MKNSKFTIVVPPCAWLLSCSVYKDMIQAVIATPVVCAGVCTDTSQSQAAAMSSGGLVSTVQPALKISTGFVPVVFISGLLHHSSSLSVLCSALGTLDDSLSKKPNRA